MKRDQGTMWTTYAVYVNKAGLLVPVLGADMSLDGPQHDH